MESKDTTRKAEEQGQLKTTQSNNILKNIKSNHILKIFFDYLNKRKSLQTIKYNKSIQKRIDININDYKAFSEQYSSIELEIIPTINKCGEYININREDEKYYHIYFNYNEKNEINKINVIIDYQIKCFKELFIYCDSVESIYFKKFYRNNITDMSCMFYGCSKLKELNLNNFNTNNVTNMRWMFRECSSLKELNLNNFNTNNVTNMSCMFNGCSSLKELNLNNFNTNNVTDMSYMFSKCTDELKLKLKCKFNEFKEEAFEDYED